jgi:hypothetical protein
MFSSNTSQVSDEKLYSEDVFSSYLYTGTGAAQTITNGIDLAGKGGLVWAKARSSAFGHAVFDTVRGSSSGNARRLITNSTAAATTTNEDWLSFNSNGFTANADPGGGIITTNGTTYASWTFRKAPKFFDVVTYTGTGANRTISHNLGVAPGCIIVKRTDTTGDWQVYHRSNANTQYMVLNSTAAVATGATRWNSTTPTATEFSLGTDATVNASGGTYVAYLFAHDATSDGIIQCGSYSGNDANLTVTLGFEPQWILIKSATMSGSTYGNWHIVDNMRGLNDTLSASSPPYLRANTSAAEATGNPNGIAITSTGFRVNSSWSISPETYIYIAIRRGPMKIPTLGTSVFSPVVWSGNATSPRTITGGGFPVDLSVTYNRNTAGWDHGFVDRLRGAPKNTSTAYFMYANGTVQEITNQYGAVGALDIQDGVGLYTGSSTFDNTNASGNTYVGHLFRRAPGFFDEVCYSIPSAGSVSHNLGVVPEMMILKTRNASDNWYVYHAGASGKLLRLNTTAAADTADYSSVWGSSAPTATNFNVGGWGTYFNYVWYGFASCPGVSKCGSYTGNGSSQTINCGFAAGARFVLIKRTDSTGDWYVWDTARGIVAGNDPHLSLNTTAAEVTTDDTIDTNSSGFVVNQVAATNVNVSSATYIYLAIA